MVPGKVTVVESVVSDERMGQKCAKRGDFNTALSTARTGLVLDGKGKAK